MNYAVDESASFAFIRCVFGDPINITEARERNIKLSETSYYRKYYTIDEAVDIVNNHFGMARKSQGRIRRIK